ncbi:MAG TPA: Uma2 family endonuclease [Oscillatoriaceae cyanobacterium M33_DOE_052]|uniref:Uma2 family endonuclease n=1 Tax=Planktothricoides sp. SpSt-374 TaxID=2282167 RepID=A0A7C3VRP8_9CYAN|nr:Uma2 family endonuclease [Oscillatoriaceae cyanobacterium M33_DOE_052]
MIASPQPSLTPEEYLELEAQSAIKHEYIDGEVYAMAGTTDTHNTIALNLATLIRSHLRGTDCRVYFADIKAQIEKRNCFYYPDLLVTCHPQDRETSTYKRFPKLIIEVLSDSTEAFDRGDKFNDYQTLESLEEYVLVNTKHPRIEIFRRNQQGLWLYQSYSTTAGNIKLQSIDLTMTFEGIYEDVTLEAASPTKLE